MLQEIREIRKRSRQLHMANLANLCRAYLKEIIKNGYTGYLSLGGPHKHSEESVYAKFYFLRDGELQGRFYLGRRWFFKRYYEDTEVTPETIPFGAYSRPRVLENIAEKLNKIKKLSSH